MILWQLWGKDLRCQARVVRMWQAVRARLRRTWMALAMMMAPCQSHCHSLLAPEGGEPLPWTPGLTRSYMRHKLELLTGMQHLLMTEYPGR